MKKRNKLFAVLLALSTMTSSVVAVNIADPFVWGGGGELEITNIFKGTPNVMTANILKQLRYRKKADGDLIWYTPVGNNILELGYMTSYSRFERNSAFKNPDLSWIFDDNNKVLTVVRDRYGSRTTTYSELENIHSIVNEDAYYGRVNGKMMPASAINDINGERVQFIYDKYGRIKGVKQATGTTQYVYETENFEIRPHVAGKSLSGELFDFKIVTTLNEKNISIVANMHEEPYGWEISHDYIKANYGLTCVDNGDDMTKTWTFTMPIYNPGAPRTFWVKTDGRDYGIGADIIVRRSGISKALSLSVTPGIGNRTAIGVSNSGTNFHFTAITNSQVDKIDIAADMPYSIGQKNYWTISYDHLLSNCQLTSWENGGGTKTWEFYLPIYEKGWPRRFWVLADGVDNGIGVPVNVY